MGGNYVTATFDPHLSLRLVTIITAIPVGGCERGEVLPRSLILCLKFYPPKHLIKTAKPMLLTDQIIHDEANSSVSSDSVQIDRQLRI